MPRPTSQDLAGFWDLLQLSIDDVTAKFDELQQMKANAWRPVESPEKKVCPAGKTLAAARASGSSSSEAAKYRFLTRAPVVRA